MSPTICLAMVCKNEAANIARALKSAIPYVTQYVVVDTGSTDGTQDVIRKEMEGIPGTIHELPWLNWSHNRNEVVRLAFETGADFVMILDADEKLIVPENFFLSLNPDNAYWFTVCYGQMQYGRPNIISKKHNWHYVGVTHEYLTPDPDEPPAVLLPIKIETLPERCTKTVEKCMLDVKLLEDALVLEPENSRYVFYLAQSYRDTIQYDKAIETYTKRAKMGGWYEEIWYSLFQIAEIKVRSKAPEEEIVLAYLNAYDFNPNRAESLGALARYLRLHNRFHSACLFAERATKIPRPNEQLFVETIYYAWLALDELSVALFWTGRYKESVETCDKLLTVAPPQELERILRNRQFSLDKMNPPVVVKPAPAAEVTA